jgi:hypothetical protein
MEALGGIGSKAPQLFSSVLYQSSNDYKKDLATKLGDNLNFVMEQNSPDRINTWADNMLKQKLIDEETHAKIMDNAKVSADVNNIFDNSKGEMSITERAIDKIKNRTQNQKVKNRLADIISERGYLEKTLKEVKRKNPDSSDIGKYKDALKNLVQRKSDFPEKDQKSIENLVRNNLLKRGLITEEIYENFVYTSDGTNVGVDIGKYAAGESDCVITPSRQYIDFFFCKVFFVYGRYLCYRC